MLHLWGMKRAFSAAIERWENTPPGLRLPALAAEAARHAEGLIPAQWLQRWMHLLLFHSAYASDENWVSATEDGCRALDSAARTSASGHRKAFRNTGLPYAETQSTFTVDLMRWMMTLRDLRLSFAGQGASAAPLSTLLSLSLPPFERYLTETCTGTTALFRALGVKPADRLSFLLQQAARIPCDAATRDHLFSALQVFCTARAGLPRFSLLHNRLSFGPRSCTEEIIRRFDHQALLDSPLPRPLRLSAMQQQELCTCIRLSLALLQRETDPATWMDLRSLRLMGLERGIAIALYGLTPGRHLPLESYIGYTLLRNGYPVAYGGAWVFGRRALFGINIFPAYRGGESGYILCQLLRTFRQSFGITWFEVEPYQYGLGNPEGITSGAFWFYYRYGFRPADPALAKLAAQEHQKISSGKGYRSNASVLRRFTESNLVLSEEGEAPPSVSDITETLTAMVAANYAGDRSLAEAEALKAFALPAGSTCSSRNSLQEAAVLQLAHRPGAKARRCLLHMAMTRESDPYTYQRWLSQYLRLWEQRPQP